MATPVYLCWDSTLPVPQECTDAGLIPARWVDILPGDLFVNHVRTRDTSRWQHVERSRQWQACKKAKPGHGWHDWGFFKTPARAKVECLTIDARATHLGES